MFIEMKRRRWASVFLAVALASCTHLGPQTVPADRFNYSTAIADSWKQQTLLNIVKMRYLDMPVFVDVASIVSGYSMETTGSVGGQVSAASAGAGDNLVLGAAGKFTDRPTITYVPLTGEKFMRGLITPVDPKNIFFLLQSGYAADFVLALTVESINGVRNRSTAAGASREADPEFIQVLNLLRDVQRAGAIGMRVEEDQAKSKTAILFFRRDDVPADIVEKEAEIWRLLGLPADQTTFTLKYSPARGAPHELTVNSRSMLQIMQAFASYIDAPAEHVAEQSATPPIVAPAVPDGVTGVRIHSGKDNPGDAFVSVRYRDYWFWIEHGDWQSKRALAAVMFFFTVADTGGHETLPLITIPAQ
jgi:hypothetical protein